MLKEKQALLKDKLKNILADVGHLAGLKHEVGKEFLSRNLPIYRAIQVFMGNESMDTIGDSESDIRFLFLFCIALNKAIKEKTDLGIKINVEDYFTQLEIKQWLNYKGIDEKYNVYPIVFENVQCITDRIWQTTITAQRLAELDANNIILYNFKTQRNPKITIFGIRIDFDKKKTIEIKESMLNGKQFPDHIKLNVLNNFQEKIYYDPKKEILTIDEPSVINIFDGYHRKVANSLAVEDNPDIDFKWPILITNLSETAAKDYMIQIDKQKPIKREQIKTWDLNKKENLVVSVIADDKISKLNKVMKDQEVEIKHGRGLTTKNIIAESIKDNYTLDDNIDIRGLGNWIIEFTDYLFSLYPEELVVGKNENLINHKYMFYGYIALSAQLKDTNNWKERAKEVISNIDFDPNNPLWKEIGFNTRNMNKTIRNKIYKLYRGEGV